MLKLFIHRNLGLELVGPLGKSQSGSYLDESPSATKDDDEEGEEYIKEDLINDVHDNDDDLMNTLMIRRAFR